MVSTFPGKSAASQPYHGTKQSFLLEFEIIMISDDINRCFPQYLQTIANYMGLNFMLAVQFPLFDILNVCSPYTLHIYTNM